MRTLIGVMLALVVATPVQAAKPTPLVFDFVSKYGVGSIIKKQSVDGRFCDPAVCVYNPTVNNPSWSEPCLWDIDDHLYIGGFGTLDSSVSYTRCMIWDAVSRHIAGPIVRASTPDLIVELRYEPSDLIFRFTPRPYDSRTWEYRGCVDGPTYQENQPAVIDIEGSNGGRGVWGSVSISVVNLTGRSLRDVYAQILIGSSEPTRQATLCIGDLGPFFGGPDRSVWRQAL